jgi:TIR domain.
MVKQLLVFLSHNSQDKPIVREIAEGLQKRNINVWYDEWDLRPGVPYQEELEEALEKTEATVVFIGPNGLGKWEKPEMRIALEEQVYNGTPVIPVILPQAPDDISSRLPRFLRRNTWVDFRRGTNDEQAWKRLLFGITGIHPDRENPSNQMVTEPPRPAPQNQIANAVSNLAQFLGSGNVTFFLGSGASNLDPDSPLRAHNIARLLLIELNLIKGNYDELLPPVDVAGMYYGIRSGDPILERKLVGLIRERSTVTPPIYAHLAELLRALAKPAKRKLLSKRQQLIVTTSPDIFMERALLKAGVSFTRIVQHKSANQIQINEYKNVQLVGGRGDIIQMSSGGNLQVCNLNNTEEVDDLIATNDARTIAMRTEKSDSVRGDLLHALPLEEFGDPILYKFLGSQDVPNSCTFSTIQHFEFAQRALQSNCIPAQISQIIANTHLLFLGHAFLDPDFRLTSHILVEKPLGNDIMRFALQLPPSSYPKDIYCKIESGLWEELKIRMLKEHGIVTVEERGEVFLQNLLDELKKI